MSQTNMAPEIFKAYDIRGIYPDQIDGDGTYAISRAFARVLAEELGRTGEAPASGLRIGVGHDMRLSSPELAERFCSGLVDEGCQVTFVGMVGTEMLYYLVGSRDLDGGAMITASHNPKGYAGMKLVKRGAVALSGDRGIQDVRRTVEAEEFQSPVAQGSAKEVNIYPQFHERALEFIDAGRIAPLDVVLDGGNGMAGPMVGPILDRLPIKQFRQYFEPDGNFPNHEPNPLLEENRAAIIAAVREHAAQLGIAWDGDADRCFFIDETGEFVPGDFVTALLAEALLRKHPGATVLYDVRASRAVAETVERAGGTALINRVGHAFFKTRMSEEDAIFGGEVSGHYYFKEFWCADSGTIPALLILELLSVEGKTMAELLEPYRERYFISGEINTEVDDQQSKMRELAEIYSDAKITELDGVSIDYDDWHFNVRPSNTEPLLRLNLEASSQAEMERRRDRVLEVIRSSK